MVLLQWFWLGVALALFLLGPNKKALMPEWLWLGLGLGFGIALGPLSKKATMAARLRRMLGCAAPIRVAPWPDLPPELTAQILARLLSHTDRLSFGAVCCGWRLAARQHRSLLPSSMPWIKSGSGA